MSTFDDRENAFEAKFAHDSELQFRAEARRNKALGLWAAGLLDKSGDAALAYAAEVVMSDIEEPGEDDVYRKVHADIGHLVPEAGIRAKMADLMAEVKAKMAADS